MEIINLSNSITKTIAQILVLSGSYRYKTIGLTHMSYLCKYCYVCKSCRFCNMWGLERLHNIRPFPCSHVSGVCAMCTQATRTLVVRTLAQNTYQCGGSVERRGPRRPKFDFETNMSAENEKKGEKRTLRNINKKEQNARTQKRRRGRTESYPTKQQIILDCLPPRYVNRKNAFVLLL